MGKYALENYSPYETYIIRPRPLGKSQENPGRGQVTYLRYEWSELEPERGRYLLDQLQQDIKTTMNSVLVIRAASPGWLKMDKEACFAALIRRIGSSLTRHNLLVGVIVTSINDAVQIWDAYLEAFDSMHLLADVHHKKLINYLKERKEDFGLVVTCCEDNRLECCEAFARNQLQHVWEKVPVLLEVTEAAVGEAIRRESLRWHAGFSSAAMEIGYLFSLRRVMYPKRISSKGALPIRFWFVNEGSAPCYMEYILRIKLKAEDKEYTIQLNIDRKAWQLGDITHNEIVQLPEMIPGTYTLWTGIFFEDDLPMKLNIASDEAQGYYEVGVIEADLQEREEYFHIWEEFYPEGYYPLEDPKTPN